MDDEIRIIRLPDGRELAWRDLGDPHGVPVVAFHGSPATGHDFVKLASVAAGYRLIAPDRPGYGHSTDDRRGSLSTWMDDVARLADHLGLAQFGVVGVSGGGPSAVAAARFLPNRLIGCAVVSSPAPPGAVVDDADLTELNRLLGRLLRRAPRLTPHVIAPVMTLMLRRLRRDPDRMVPYMERSLPAPDRELLARDDVRRAFREDLSQPVSKTAGRAAVRDYELTLHGWGFRLEDITVPVHVWHGGQDRNAPIGNGVFLAERIPRAIFHRLPDSGHLLVYEHFAAIVRALAQRRE